MTKLASPEIVVEVCGRTDVGIARMSNEDALLIGDLDRDRRIPPQTQARLVVGDRGPLMVVCDGMGGAAAGEVASALAVDVVLAEMNQLPASPERAVFGRFLRRAVRVANRRVFDEGCRDWKLKGMGTTLSAAGLSGTELVIAQVGDSRAYVLREHTLVQVTRDQSIVSALLQSGRITEQEAENFAHANVILQALGVHDDVDVALSIVELRRGDRLVLCSDGLHGPVGDEEIRRLLEDHPEPAAATQALIEAACDAGGPDNVTAIVASFGGDGLPPPASVDDLPTFIEFEPTEEGANATTTTSRVGHRLAARAGVGDDPGPRRIPVTSQHVAIVEPPDELDGPASAALETRSRLGLITWAAAGALVLAIIALLVWGR